jgi:threonine/homoserine/homoserine lactone efflux protein
VTWFGERNVTAGGQAEGALELTRHMALIGETAGGRGIGEGRPVANERARPVEAAQREIAIWAGAEAGAEVPRQREARQTRRLLERRRSDGRFEISIEKFPRPTNRAPMPRPELASAERPIARRQRLGYLKDEFVALEVLEREIEIGERWPRCAGKTVVTRYRIADERQGSSLAQRLLYRARLDVENAIAKARAGAGMAVMRLVRMQHEDLAGNAALVGTAIPKRLHAGKRGPNGVGVVAMRVKGIPCEKGLDALQPAAAGADAEPIGGPGRARSFKTFGASLRHKSCHALLYQIRFVEASESERAMDGVTSFALAGLALAGSPGPATLSLAATGAAFGARRGFAYMAGIILGMVAVMAIVASGLIALVLAIPGATPAVSALAGAYFLYLACRIATAPPLSDESAAPRRPSFTAGVLLSLINPKGYAAMAALFSGFVLVREHLAADAAAKILVLLVIITAVNIAWLFAGAALTRHFREPLSNRIINVTFAVLLVGSAAPVLLL